MFVQCWRPAVCSSACWSATTVRCWTIAATAINYSASCTGFISSCSLCRSSKRRSTTVWRPDASNAAHAWWCWSEAARCYATTAAWCTAATTICKYLWPCYAFSFMPTYHIIWLEALCLPVHVSVACMCVLKVHVHACMRRDHC